MYRHYKYMNKNQPHYMNLLMCRVLMLLEYIEKWLWQNSFDSDHVYRQRLIPRRSQHSSISKETLYLLYQNKILCRND